jgi:RNA polymerase sigma-70 factor (ECF subfamily)
MLGSVADAEDVVQEAQLRLHQTNPQPDSPEAFLYRVVSNLCVDKLRRDKVRRKHYFGPWLPEPIASPPEDIDLLEMAEQLSMGFMLMLEQLSPAERVVYVLREGFDFSFAEIATVLGVSAANARQRAHRARARLKDQKPVSATPAKEQKTLLEAMLLRVAERDVDGLVALMAENAVAYTDGGGIVSAAVQPIHGHKRIAQVTMHLAIKAQSEGDVTFEFVPMNGGWGLVVKQDGAPHSCFQVDVSNGLIEHIYVVRNPEKLARLA